MIKQLFSVNSFLVLLVFFTTSLTIAVAQQSDTEIRIKIEKEVDGEKQTIDKTFTDPDDPELKKLLKEQDEIGEIDIDVDEDIQIIKDGDQKSLNIDLDTEDAESVEQFKQQIQQLADDMGLDVEINEGNSAKKEMRIFKHLPDGDEDFDMNKLFDNLDEDVKEWIDTDQLKEKLNKSLKDWDIDLDDWNLDNAMPSKLNRPMMGVTIKDVEEGILIENVSKESGAELAGLEAGDIIKKINGEKMNNVDEVIEYISEMKAGDMVQVEFERGGKSKKAGVELKARMQNNFKRSYQFDDNGSMKKFKFDSDDMDLNNIDQWIEEKVEDVNGKKTSTRVMVMITDLEDEDVETLKDISPNASLSKIDKDEIDELEFFPNPSKGVFNLRFDLEQSADTQINIYDINGKTVYSKTLENFDGTFDEDIDISSSDDGTYILEIVRDNKRFNKKVIIE